MLNCWMCSTKSIEIAMKDLPYWLDIPYTPRASLSKDVETDVVVIGGGLTGVSAAYHAVKAGFKTVLIEKDVVANGSAGRNGGMIVEGMEIDFAEAIEKYGLEEAKELWANTVAAQALTIALICEHSIDCDFDQKGSLYIGISSNESGKIRKEAETRRSQGFDAEIIEKGKQFKQSPFDGMLLNPKDATLHPVKFIRGLAEVAEKFGTIIFEHTPAITYDAHTVKTPQGTITAKRVVLALESGSQNILANKATIVRSQAIVTKPLSNEKLASLDWQKGNMFWVVENDYISCRTIGNRLFICKSVSVDATPQELDKNKDLQVHEILSFFPTLTQDDLEVSHQWSGLMVENHNHRPHIREVNGCFEISGHAGNGLTNAIMCGKLIADFLSGKPIPKIYV